MFNEGDIIASAIQIPIGTAVSRLAKWQSRELTREDIPHIENQIEVLQQVRHLITEHCEIPGGGVVPEAKEAINRIRDTINGLDELKRTVKP